MKVLIAKIEISDHPARDRSFVVGVFSYESEIDKAKAAVERAFSDRRVWWKEHGVVLNNPIIPRQSDLA